MRDDSGAGAAGVILSFLVGALSGAALAILFAPRSGRETREYLGDRLREGAERGKELRGRVVARGRDVVGQAEGFIEKQRSNVKESRERLAAAIDAGREAYHAEKDKS
jgi:gas vesicle protein